MYTVERVKVYKMKTCEKHELQLLKNGETVFEDRVSFSPWQLKDDLYKDRLKKWGENMVEDCSKDQVEIGSLECETVTIN